MSQKKESASPLTQSKSMLTPKNIDFWIASGIGIACLVGLSLWANIQPHMTLTSIGALLAMLCVYWLYRRAQRARSETQRISPTGAEVYKIAAKLIDTLPQAAAIIDKSHKVLHANTLARDLVNRDMTGQPLAASIAHPQINKRLARALAGYQPDPLMLHVEESQEQYIRLLFSRTQNFGASAQIGLTFVVFDDVTDANVEAQRRADFLANASHELKTPIASLMGYIETLRGHAKNDPDAQERFLGIMQAQASRMQRLIDDLLSLRKIELAEHVAPSEVADLHLAVTTALEAVDPLCEKRGVDVRYKSVGKNKALVRGKQDECVQLCLNLIENAVKISPAKSAVTVSLRKLDQWSPVRAFEDGRLPVEAASRRIINAPPSPLPAWLITISDSGPGFAREHIARVGERFYRIAGDLSSKEKGTGLGLAIVKHIVRRHRGGLYIRSEHGTGTDFSILLMAEEDAGKAPEPDLDGAKSKTTKKNKKTKARKI